jgi:uncharacterized protein YceH (UPF0502 family)
MLAVDYQQVIPVLVGAIKEHILSTDAEFAAKAAENAAQARRIEDLESRLASLAERLEALERR